MGDPQRISKDDWEVILHAPFQVYSLIASAEDEPSEAQFRSLTGSLERARDAFATGTIGHAMIDALTSSLDPLWAGYQAAGRDPKRGLSRVSKALGKAPDDESIAIRDWLVTLALTIAESRHDMGADTISEREIAAINDIAHWIDRPAPTTTDGGSG